MRHCVHTFQVFRLSLLRSLSFSTSNRVTMASKGKKHERSSSFDDGLRHPTTKRAKEIDTEDNPYEKLIEVSKAQDKSPKPSAILHWFREQDIRLQDNAALSAASAKAKDASVPLLTIFLFSPSDMEWHGLSPAKIDFILESLKLLQSELKKLHIPLALLTADSRAEKGKAIVDFVKKYKVSHIFANFEYEVDELRRDLGLYERLGTEETSFELFHDQTVMEPGILTTGSGSPMKVFTPYHKAWLQKVGSQPKLLDTYNDPAANDKDVSTKYKDLFSQKFPEVPKSKQFQSESERKSIRELWPAGHQAAMKRLDHFLGKKVKTYKTNRSTPATDNSSRLSAYFSAGVLSVRQALSAARKANDNQNFETSGDFGIYSWARELVFREFYRHMLILKPHNAMNLPSNLKFDFVQWEDDQEGFEKWCEGKTGMPFIDAGMRQLNTEAYMHNRLRMNTASYLRTNLLIDYRKGERYFSEHLIDWDLANNTNGWEPSYTVFNPVVQAEKCDPDGEYIRKWVPELKDVEGKAIFDPYNRLGKEEFEKLGYPAPHVDFKESRQRCLERYKSDMADADP